MANTETDKKDPARTEVSEETLLKLSKEIAIKFIEVGRITPTTFSENFKLIHTAIKDSVDKEKA